MCVVSMVGDHYNDKWRDFFPKQPLPNNPFIAPQRYTNFPEITREEFNQLKKEVEDMKELLK